MSAVRWPAAAWSLALTAASGAFGAWLLVYFSERRHRMPRTPLEFAFDSSSDLGLLTRLFLLSPYIALAIAAGSAAVAWRCLAGSRRAPWLSFASMAVLPAVYLVGMQVLQQLENRNFFAKSPWVNTFKTGCLALAVCAIAVLVWVAVLAVLRRRR